MIRWRDYHELYTIAEIFVYASNLIMKIASTYPFLVDIGAVVQESAVRRLKEKSASSSEATTAEVELRRFLESESMELTRFEESCRSQSRMFVESAHF